MATQVDERGRVVLPKQLREQAGLTPGTEVHFFIGPDGLTLRPARDRQRSRLASIRALARSIRPENRDPTAGSYDADRIKREVWGQ